MYNTYPFLQSEPRFCSLCRKESPCGCSRPQGSTTNPLVSAAMDSAASPDLPVWMENNIPLQLLAQEVQNMLVRMLGTVLDVGEDVKDMWAEMANSIKGRRSCWRLHCCSQILCRRTWQSGKALFKLL